MTAQSEEPSAALTRGEQLVIEEAGCADCHTPHDQDFVPLPGRHLAGVRCLLDLSPPADNGVGCINAPNITSHETGLGGWTDEQIERALLTGRRPDGSVIFHLMPYQLFSRMTEEDADAVVLYLRSVPPVDSDIPPSEPIPPAGVEAP